MILNSLLVDPATLETATGWTIKTEGACKGDVCVPLPTSLGPGSAIDAHVLSESLGMPLVADDAHGLWALGPESSITGRALTTAVAPDIVLPDLDGRPVRIADLRPMKVVLVAWASW